ncbi:MAG: FHA domain-containing protein [Thermoanaerobaculia bacterium]
MSDNGWQVFVEVPGKAPIELHNGEAVVGRSRSCIVQIAETTVSRQHAVFVVEPGNVRLRDLGSSNGTYVNGKRVDGSVPLNDGDRVVIGEAELIVRILAPLGPAEATQKLVLPPLTVPQGAAPVAAEEPRPSFVRTPTAVEPPGAPVPPAPTMPPVVPARPVPPRPSAAPAMSTEAAAKSELLSSIQEIDQAPIPPPVARKPTAAVVSPAGFWIRVAAALLDTIPVVLLLAIGFALAYFVSPEAAILTSVLQFGYGLYLAVIGPALQGTTPGKKLLKLAIVSDTTSPGQGLGWGTAFLRLVGHLVCSLTFSLGYLLVAFTAEKQGLHDLIAKTHVVRRR